MESTTNLRSKMSFASVLVSVVALASGCASLKSPTQWFSRDAASTGASTDLVGTSVTSTGKGIAGQFRSMGSAVTSAMGKAKNAVTSTFSPTGTENTDPLSLANMPSEILPEVFVTNGQLFESQGNYTKALDNYSKALEKEPANEAALLSTASLYLRQGHLEQANEFFTKAISVNPRAETFNELALVQQKQGLHADAQASIGQAIARAPQSLLYRNNLANMLVSVGRSDEAVKQLEQVLAPAQANYNVACLHFSNNNLAAAQQHLQIALQADPNLVDARQLMDRIVSNPTTKTAIAAYQNAAEVYRAVGQSSAAGPVTTIR